MNNILNRSPGFIRFSEYNLKKKTMLIHSRIGCLTTVYNDNMINIACNGLFLPCPSSCSGSDSDNYSASSLCIGSKCWSVYLLFGGVPCFVVRFLSGVSFERVCSRSVYIVVGSWFIALLSCWLGGGGSFSGLTSSGLTILNVSKLPDIFWTSVFLNYVLFVTSFTCTIFFCFHIYIPLTVILSPGYFSYCCYTFVSNLFCVVWWLATGWHSGRFSTDKLHLIKLVDCVVSPIRQ